jgi:hypothetical protein
MQPIKIEAGDNGNFIIDGDRRQKGSYAYTFTDGGNKLSLYSIFSTKSKVYKGNFPNGFVKANDTVFSDKADFINYVNAIIFS